MALTVSQVARWIEGRTGRSVSPQAISNLFYRRKLDDHACPVVGRIRVIPDDYVPVIELALRREGLLPSEVDDAQG